jgi:hypothetical protein
VAADDEQFLGSFAAERRVRAITLLVSLQLACRVAWHGRDPLGAVVVRNRDKREDIDDRKALWLGGGEDRGNADNTHTVNRPSQLP